MRFKEPSRGGQSARGRSGASCLLILLAAFIVAKNGNAVSTRNVENRQILDPCLGLHWQLRADPEHPGGPAHLVLTGRGDIIHGIAPLPLQSVVIRPGQLVLVNQDSNLLHATLQAVALESAVVGQSIKVRLGAAKGFLSGPPGATISVVVTGIGTAQWLSPRADRRTP